jgi:RHH-type rel operon transcriptional repressor/antitoxin RelB
LLSLRLPEAIEKRLDSLASETGRTKTALVSEAILEYIGDLDDFYLAETRARLGRKTISLAEVERELDLAD